MIKFWRTYEFELYLRDQNAQWAIIQEHEHEIKQLRERLAVLELQNE